MTNSKVYLCDGPKNGHVVYYSQPLPKILVVSEKTPMGGFIYHDYKRVNNSKRYRYIKPTLHDGD